jgi:hypothetical protein
MLPLGQNCSLLIGYCLLVDLLSSALSLSLSILLALCPLASLCLSLQEAAAI